MTGRHEEPTGDGMAVEVVSMDGGEGWDDVRRGGEVGRSGLNDAKRALGQSVEREARNVLYSTYSQTLNE